MSEIVVQPTAALDVTYVLCESCGSQPCRLEPKRHAADNEESTLSLIMALLTLTPILLNVRATLACPTSPRCTLCPFDSQRMRLWLYKRVRLSSSRCGQAKCFARPLIGC